MKITPLKISPSRKGLLLRCGVDSGGGLRIVECIIPWAWVLERQVLIEMDRATRRRLIETWSEQPIEDPLF